MNLKFLFIFIFSVNTFYYEYLELHKNDKPLQNKIHHKKKRKLFGMPPKVGGYLDVSKINVTTFAPNSELEPKPVIVQNQESFSKNVIIEPRIKMPGSFVQIILQQMLTPDDNMSIRSIDQIPMMEVLGSSHKNEIFMNSKKDNLDTDNYLDNINSENKNYRIIHNTLAKKVLDEVLYSNPELVEQRILVFRKKKIIKTRATKNYGLYDSYNHCIDQGNINKNNLVLKYRYREEKMLKKIRKCAILKRLQNYWKDQKQNYPSVYKQIYFEKEDGINYLEEISDLTKKQFDNKEIDFV